jgi:hypothetical protein
VFDDTFARPVLYTWTTDTQADELRATRVLLARSRSPKRGPSHFDSTLQRDADGTSAALARALRKAPLARRRFAWPAAYATILGFGKERYGDRLIRVELKPEAVVARYAPGTPSPWAFHDLKGHPVAASTVVDHPETLGAIYHVAQASPAAEGREASPGYREYVLCNEAMIASFSESTDAIRAEIDAEIAALRALAGSVSSGAAAGEPAGEADAAWSAGVGNRARAAAAPDMPPRARYEASLAFGTPPYRPTQPRLAALITALARARPSGDPLDHRPSGTAQASASAAAPPAPTRVLKPRCIMDGSFERCTPLPPSRRFAHDGRWCADPVTGAMIACKR